MVQSNYKPITNRARERRTKLSTPQILFGGQVYPFGKSSVSYPCCGDTSAVCYSYLTIRLSEAEISSISAVTMPLGSFKMARLRLARRSSFSTLSRCPLATPVRNAQCLLGLVVLACPALCRLRSPPPCFIFLWLYVWRLVCRLPYALG